MPTLEDLARRVKAKYPGSYDDLDDIDLAARIKQKYPGAYDDFTNKVTQEYKEQFPAVKTRIDAERIAQDYADRFPEVKTRMDWERVASPDTQQPDFFRTGEHRRIAQQEREAITGVPQPRQQPGGKLRPRINLGEGRYATERTITVTHPEINQGRPTNIPSIYGGEILGDTQDFDLRNPENFRAVEQESIRRIIEAGGIDPETGEKPPSFDTIEQAESYARERSRKGGARPDLLNMERDVAAAIPETVSKPADPFKWLASHIGKAASYDAKHFMSGYRRAAAIFPHVLANTAMLADNLAEAINKHVFGGQENKHNLLNQVEEALRGVAADLANDPRNLAPETFDQKVLQGVGAAIPGLSAAAGSVMATGGPITGLALLGAISEADKGALKASLAAGRGALLGAVLKATSGLPRRERVPIVGGTFGAETALEGGDLTDTIVSTLIGAGLAIPGKGGPGLRERIREFTDTLGARSTIRQHAPEIMKQVVTDLQDGVPNDVIIGRVSGKFNIPYHRATNIFRQSEAVWRRALGEPPATPSPQAGQPNRLASGEAPPDVQQRYEGAPSLAIGMPRARGQAPAVPERPAVIEAPAVDESQTTPESAPALPEAQEQRGQTPDTPERPEVIALPTAPAETPPAAPAEAEQPPEPAAEPSPQEPADISSRLVLRTGARLQSQTGRELSPVPKVDATGERKTKNTLLRVNQWLIDEAIKEAESRNDDYNLTRYQQLDAKNFTQGDSSDVNLYLFGDPEGAAEANLISKPAPTPKPSTDPVDALLQNPDIEDVFSGKIKYGKPAALAQLRTRIRKILRQERGTAPSGAEAQRLAEQVLARRAAQETQREPNTEQPTSDEDKLRDELNALRKERQDLIKTYGQRGEKHPAAKMIGGINQAAQRLRVVRGRIARIEKELRPKQPNLRLIAKQTGVTERRPVGQGLLFDVYIDNVRRGSIGRDNTGKFYIVQDNSVTGEGFAKLKEAKDAFLKAPPQQPTEGSKTIAEQLGKRRSMRIGTVIINETGEQLKFSLRPDTSATGRYSAVLTNDAGQSTSYRMQFQAGRPLSEVRQAFEDYLNTDHEDQYSVELTPTKARQKPPARKPEPEGRAVDQQDRQKLRELEGRRFKTRPQELQIAKLKRRIAADPAKWSEGMGVGWRVTPDQINRGFRIISVDPETKMATIRQVADTGITTTGGDTDRLEDQQVHIADLVRDRKYDKPTEVQHKGFTIRQVGKVYQVLDAQGKHVLRANSLEGAKNRIDNRFPSGAGGAETASAEPTPTTKEPWEMTKSEWMAQRPAGTSPGMHSWEVQKALHQGKPVPTEVLAEYPDLAEQAPEPAAPKKPPRPGQEVAPPTEERGAPKAQGIPRYAELETYASRGTQAPEVKALFRRAARVFHPDLGDQNNPADVARRTAFMQAAINAFEQSDGTSLEQIIDRFEQGWATPTQEQEIAAEPTPEPAETPTQPPEPPPPPPYSSSAPPKSPLEMPEIVDLGKALFEGTRLSIGVQKSLGKDTGVRGYFTPGKGIRLRADIFKDPEAAAQTLAHEIGHAVDWIEGDPSGTLKRGNILGSIASLHRFMRREFQGILNKDIREELIKFTTAWKPFDPAADPKYTKYRHNARELYADFISGLINAPAWTQQVAPRTFDAFFQFLDRKPRVRALYDGIQGRINSGGISRRRRERLKADFARGEAARRTRAEERSKKQGGFRDWVMRKFVDKNHAILKPVRQAEKAGRIANPDDNPRYWLERLAYGKAEERAWLSGVERVHDKLTQAGISEDDFGAILFHERVIHERGEYANPEGFTPRSSQQQLDQIKADLGDARWNQAQDLATEFRGVWEGVRARMREAKILSDEGMDKLDANDFYATFNVLHHFERQEGQGEFGMSSGVFAQVGTLSEIENPYVATIMKGVSTLRMIQRKEAAHALAEFLRDAAPDSIEPAKRGEHGILQQPRNNEQGLLAYPHEGKLVGWYIPAEMEKSFDRNLTQNQETGRYLSKFAHPFRSLFTRYSPGFLVFNSIRDPKSTMMNLPTTGKHRITRIAKGQVIGITLTPYFFRAIGPSLRRGFRKPDAIIEEMERKKILASFTEATNLTPDDETVERLLKSYALRPRVWTSKVVKPFGKLFDYVEAMTTASELFTKVAAYQYLKKRQAKGGWSDAEVEHMVRTLPGTPPFLRQGEAAPIYNNFLLFSNVWKEGQRRDWEAVSRDPVDYFMRRLTWSMMPKLLMIAAAMGILGDENKAIMNCASEYDKSNYWIVPLRMRDNGKCSYLRIPDDELGRVMGGIAWQAYKMIQNEPGGNVGALFDYMAGQAPTLNPLFEAAINAVAIQVGVNPMDWFYNRPTVPEQEFAAGGWRKWSAYLNQAWNSMGGNVIYKDLPQAVLPQTATQKRRALRRAERAAEQDWLERMLDMRPGFLQPIQRFFKITDQGHSDRLRQIAQEIRQEKAETGQEINERIIDFIHVNRESLPYVLPDSIVRGLHKSLAMEGLPVGEFSDFKRRVKSLSMVRVDSPWFQAALHAQSKEERYSVWADYLKSLKNME